MLLVSMATILGTSELMMEDLNRKQESKFKEKKRQFKKTGKKRHVFDVFSDYWFHGST